MNKLRSRIRMICRRHGEARDGTTPTGDAKFVRLQSELIDHLEKLSVLHLEIEAAKKLRLPTISSRRGPFGARLGRQLARAKIESGAKRRIMIMSVLASLSKRLEHFTLGRVLTEINRWFETGTSVFREELISHQAATASGPNAPP